MHFFLWALRVKFVSVLCFFQSRATERKYDYFYKKEVVDENVKGHSIRPKQKISYSALLSSSIDSE